MSKSKSNIRIVNAHNYMTIRTPNGNFTGSWSGYKCSGRLAQDNTGAFDKMIKFIDDPNNGKTLGDRMIKLADEKILIQLWPDFNKVYTNEFKIGDRVFIPIKPKHVHGTINDILKKYCSVKWDNNTYSQIDFTLLDYEK